MYDLVIIGSGPAGLSASVYAKRAGINAITYDLSPISGGQVLSTYEVDNYLGFPGISGGELCNKFREHADRLECKIENAEVTSINKEGNGFIITTDKGECRSYAVVLATGASHAKLKVPGEEELAGMGVSYCATCDGAFFRNREVVVVGGGDVAVEDALFLARGCSKVYLVHRRDSLRAAKSLQDKLFSTENIEVIWNSRVESIQGEDQVERVILSNTQTKEESSLSVSGIFIAVGMNPVNELAKNSLKMDSLDNNPLKMNSIDMDERGFILADDDCTSSVPGIFVAGDLRTKKLRQIVTAVADGANVISSVESYLLEVKK